MNIFIGKNRGFFRRFQKEVLNKNNPFTIYTYIFVLMAFIILVMLKFNGLSLIYKGDALSQHFPSQFYLIKTINDFFFDFARNIESFNFKLGFGSDSLFTYYHYGLFDPLNILLIPLKNMDPVVVYSIRIIFRLYASGVCFIIMCRYFLRIRHEDRSVVSISLGAIIYVFSNYPLSSGVTHPYFGYSTILLPLMIIGASKLIRENSKKMFVITSFLSIVVNFYFAYIIAFQVLIYSIVYIIKVTKGKNKRFIVGFRLFFRGIYSYVIAVLLSACVIFPMIYGIVNSIRNNSICIDLPIITQRHIVLRYFFDFFKIPRAGDAVTAGIAIVTLFTISLLFCSKGRTKLKLLCAIVVVAVFVPKFQSAMTGFSYANYRWTFAVALLVSYIFVEMFDELTGLNNKENKKMLYVCYAYMFLYVVYAIHLFFKKSYPESLVLAMLDVSGLIVFLSYTYVLVYKNGNKKRRYLIAMTVVTICMSMCVYVGKASIAGVLAKTKSVRNMITSRELIELSNVSGSIFERVDNSDPRSMNFSDIYGYGSSSIYYSIENKNLSMFNLIMKNSKAAPVTLMNNMDSRVALDNLMSVKFYVGSKKIPYGYEQTYMKDVYVNSNYIPFGFTYDSFVDYKQVRDYSSLDLQELMLRSCVVEDVDKNIKNKIKSGNIARNVEKTGDNLSVKLSLSGKIKTSKKINLVADLKANKNGELYLHLPSQDSFKNMDKLEARVNGESNRTNFTKKNTRWYSGETDSLINLGYLKKGTHKVEISIPSGVEFDTKDISFEIRDVKYVEEASKVLSKEYLKKISTNSRGFEGEIDVSKDKLMFVSIPYGDSWRAFVDGREAEIKKANIGFMAIHLGKGRHRVRFVYDRPYQKIGLIVSLGTLLLLGIFKLYSLISKKSV